MIHCNISLGLLLLYQGDVLLTPALVNVIKKGYQVDIDFAEEGLPAKCFQKGNQMLAYDLQNMDRYGAYRSKRYLVSLEINLKSTVAFSFINSYY